MNAKAIAMIQQGLAMLTAEGGDEMEPHEMDLEAEEAAPPPAMRREGRGRDYQKERKKVRKVMEEEE